MEQKAIFLDVDGTIAQPGEMSLLPSAREAMERARARGHKVVLCSGRGYDGVRALLDFPFDAVVTNAGAYILCGEEVLVDFSLPPETLRYMREQLDASGILYSVMCHESSFSTPGYRDLILKSIHRGSNSEIARWGKFFEHTDEVTLAHYRGEPAQKIIFLAHSPQQLQGPIAALEGEFECCVMGTDQFGVTNGELIHRAHSKGAAVRRLCEHWALPLSASIAFGDSMNDASMLLAAGLGVCMGNGGDQVKALADQVCLPYDRGGVLHTLEALGLI